MKVSKFKKQRQRSLCGGKHGKAVDEMADEKTFRGYPPEQGYDFVRQKILEHDYLARGIKMQLDEIFLSKQVALQCLVNCK